MSVIQHTNTREDGFEQLIERALVGTTIESRRAQGIELNAEAAAAQTPSAENFYWGLPKDFLHREAVTSVGFGRSSPQPKPTCSTSGAVAVAASRMLLSRN